MQLDTATDSTLTWYANDLEGGYGWTVCTIWGSKAGGKGFWPCFNAASVIFFVSTY
ncbi:hypothetical protein EX30DRAFT_344487 [Ascodesmis nigricans]|uniref:Uncharacterized protein n=1 Tax=Ascodesmis nigricans TaxID=341454 RepID=A0A4S2MNW8_9PEZI|nr:hypothetical protein EX30DRAFT_344487 [Ascodesmis nigricans]